MTTAEALHDTLISVNESDRNHEDANVVDGLFAIAKGLNAIAKSIDRLGTNDAATRMGALEVVAMEIKNGMEAIAGAIERHDD